MWRLWGSRRLHRRLTEVAEGTSQLLFGHICSEYPPSYEESLSASSKPCHFTANNFAFTLCLMPMRSGINVRPSGEPRRPLMAVIWPHVCSDSSIARPASAPLSASLRGSWPPRHHTQNNVNALRFTSSCSRPRLHSPSQTWLSRPSRLQPVNCVEWWFASPLLTSSQSSSSSSQTTNKPGWSGDPT